METRIREKTVAVYEDLYFEKTSSGSGSIIQLTEGSRLYGSGLTKSGDAECRAATSISQKESNRQCRQSFWWAIRPSNL